MSSRTNFVKIENLPDRLSGQLLYKYFNPFGDLLDMTSIGPTSVILTYMRRRSARNCQQLTHNILEMHGKIIRAEYYYPVYDPEFQTNPALRSLGGDIARDNSFVYDHRSFVPWNEENDDQSDDDIPDQSDDDIPDQSDDDIPDGAAALPIRTGKIRATQEGEVGMDYEEEMLLAAIERLETQRFKTTARLECMICYDDCPMEDMVPCTGDHMFCLVCVKRGANVAIGEGNTKIACFVDPSEEITWVGLMLALDPKTLWKLQKKRQLEEVVAAGLQNLVQCPFCTFAVVNENPNNTVLVCYNPECGQESCIRCKLPSHVPLRCEEVETADEEAWRRKVEDTLSLTMIRKCPKCNVTIIKEEGCNHITCRCGAHFCYVCKKSHMIPHMRCNDRPSNELHANELAEAARQARQEMAEKNITLNKKWDPTKDFLQ